ncbi:MAG: DUF4386 domain-containing protein [Pseudonocardia sp.]|uniref:DUF4386 domain-containing protein n=1 Tax=unclassified Pseudonocardia TaxID=2619320 RepID=UPI00086DE9A7|nr:MULTISPECIES: DUF4386 domain-containing protein [unclassified Pseudonocardia]MBN9112414.1 DUF4386 domain-containing protein [Pseudonocardia sp.]ODU27312.1 MAG: hypothetical protein ABS80_04015 [Pseudonocardia sp. SCN 72-51]ODV08925.1 MAG: hypothetical protein ABT15_01405 [Pseudonocardia sp. SCN 73-27]
MTATEQPTADPTVRRTARIAGGFYLLSFVSIPTLILYSRIHDPEFITSAASQTPVVIGGILEIVVALACIGTAVALYPALRTHGPARALGFVAARVTEGTAILVGVAALLTVLALKRAGAGADTLTTGHALVAFYDANFLLSQGLIPAANALLLGTLLYQTRLVPRALPVIGFVGAGMLVASDIGTLLGIWDRVSPIVAIAAIPIAVWEFSLGIYLMVKGLRAPQAPDTSTAAGAQRMRAAAPAQS